MKKVIIVIFLLALTSASNWISTYVISDKVCGDYHGCDYYIGFPIAFGHVVTDMGGTYFYPYHDLLLNIAIHFLVWSILLFIYTSFFNKK